LTKIVVFSNKSFFTVLVTDVENTSGLSVRLAAHAAVEAMRMLAADLKIPDHLSEFGIQDKDIPELAAGVMKVTRLLANNPRELTQKDAEAIYRSVL